MNTLRVIVLVGTVVVTSACSVIGGSGGRFGDTLADLPPPVLPSEIEPIQPATLDQIEESYRAALDVAKSVQLRHRILVRLADIEMIRSENRQMSEEEQQQYFDDAIAMYDELLVVSDTNGTEEIDDERLLYRLSKAYALDGRMDESDEALARLVNLYPESPFAAEAEFRRAEQAFSSGDYASAEALYQKVINVGDSTPFYLNAVYMLGWSQFKASQFRRSISAFTEVLDRLIPEPSDEPLSPASNGLLDDTLRVMGITFTYLDGAASITQVYNALGERHYQYLIYRRLGELYLDKELYKDAADTYTHYIDTFPNSIHGPDFASYRMKVFTEGGLPDQILPAKEEFVQSYGIHSAYWAQFGETQRNRVLPYLDTYLDELSSYYHAEGLALQKALNQYEQSKKAGKRVKKPQGDAQPKFFRAAAFYQEYIQTFPDSPRKAEMTFLMGEAYYEGGELLSAVGAYEKVAYDMLDGERGAKAGYAAILALQSVIDKTAPEDPQRVALKQHKIQSSINFADYYPGDERSVAVLTQAAQDVFSGGEQAQAVAIAKRITVWQPAPKAELLRTAWLIVAHSEFDAGEYSAAEQSYRQVLTLLPLEDPDRTSIVERIAASMFKAAEQSVVAGNTEQAIEQLLLIQQTAPDSELAISGQYDAGNYLMDLKQWQRAENIFVELQARYPQHQLIATLPPKLAVIYQELEQWDRAAAVLAQMASSESDPETRRQSLYLSAELYQKSGRLKQAGARFADYVKRYPEPFDLAIEARYQALLIAQERKSRQERNYWLNQLIKADAKAGSNGTDRSRYLAAFASNQFAGDAFARFEKIKLTLPIKKSLKAKKKALDETLRAYKKVIDFGVAEFMTEANYRIGNVYSQLSRDLMNSERPKGLDELTLEQYEILLEEQAYPFEEKSVELLQANAERAWDGFYDDWVKQSFKELAKMLPARYGKKEKEKEVSHGLH